jgi:DNA-binding transcriptional MocR family regulator
MQVALRSLETHLPSNVIWTKPDGGYTLWIKLRNSYTDEENLKRILIKNSVLVSPGIYYFYGSQNHHSFRLSIASLNEREISEGIKRLGKAIRQLNK